MRSGSQGGQANVEYAGALALVALALIALLAVGASGGPGLPQAIARAILPDADPGPRPAAVPALIDDLMAADLEDFLAYRASDERDPRLDFSTDLCTAPVLGSSGPTYDFTEACLRHDFGYRNYGPLGTLDERRSDVDERFLADMRASCLERPPEHLVRCHGWARTYHRAVRAFGWIPARRYE